MPCALREPTTTRPDPARSGRTGNHPEEKTMAMTGVLRPGHISLRVLDLEEGIKFYKDTLGLLETGRDGKQSATNLQAL